MPNALDNLYETQMTIDQYGADTTLDYIISNSSILTKFIDNKLSSINSYSFQNLSNLQKVQLDNVQEIGSAALRECNNLETLLMPNFKSCGMNAFYQCNNLKTVDCGLCSTILSDILDSNVLETIILRKNNNIVSNILTKPGNYWCVMWGRAKFYVPSNLLTTYKTDSRWTIYKNRIFTFEDYPVQEIPDSISDSWSEIITKINNGTETYEVGDTKTMNINGENIVCKIIAKDADTITGTQNTAKTTWIAYYPFEAVQWHTTSGKPFVTYENSYVRNYINNNIFSLFPQELKDNIKQVDKTSLYRDNESNFYDTTSSEKLFLFSGRELNNSNSESTGPIYFNNISIQLKLFINNTLSSYSYWTRSYLNSSQYNIRVVSNSGGFSNYSPTATKNILVGFCI